MSAFWHAGGAVTAVSGLPAAPSQPLPLLASLTKVPPSPLLQWQLLDILYTYCFVMRLYNGDYSSDPQVWCLAIKVLLAISGYCSLRLCNA